MGGTHLVPLLTVDDSNPHDSNPHGSNLCGSNKGHSDRTLPIPADIEKNDWHYLSGCSSAAARKLLPLSDALRLRCLPLALIREGAGEALSVLAAPRAERKDGFLELAKELRFITGRDIIIETGTGPVIERAIAAAYHSSDERIRGRLEKAERSVLPAPRLIRDLAGKSDEPVPLLLEALLERADSLGASDIHLEPHAEGLRLRFRIDGRLRTDTEFVVSTAVGENLFRRIKLLSQLDITGSGKPQEGGFTFAVGTRRLRLRVSFVPQHYGEKGVLRILESPVQSSSGQSSTAQSSEGLHSPFEALGLSDGQQRLLRMHLGASSGAVLLAGPTGSGKSTLLYAALDHLNAEWRNIVTLEDPVERTIPGINQIEIAKGSQHGFADMLASLLRQDPDVLMVGEIRDRETGQTALTAAITGHLMLSTVHAGSAVEIIPRLLQLGIDSQLLSCSLRLLSAQRLLPLNCMHCRKAAEIPELWRKLLVLGRARCFSSSGCAACRGTGVRGRIGIYEFLPLTVRTREALWDADKKGAGGFSDFANLAREDGYEPLVFAARGAVLRGDVSPEKALQSLGAPLDFAG